MYFRPEGADLLLVGLEDGSEMGGSPDRETVTANAGFRDTAAERLVQRVPGLVDATFRTAHAGQDGLSPDQRAILGQLISYRVGNILTSILPYPLPYPRAVC